MLKKRKIEPASSTGAFTTLRNLGPASWQMLQLAGIHSEDQLRTMGSLEAYLAVKSTGCSPGLNLLWALEGALTDCGWQHIARTRRKSLLQQLKRLEASL